MNNNNCILEAVGLGIVTLIIGHIAFYLGINDNQIKEKEKYYKNLSLILFLTGFILHILIVVSGFNKIYCNR